MQKRNQKNQEHQHQAEENTFLRTEGYPREVNILMEKAQEEYKNQGLKEGLDRSILGTWMRTYDAYQGLRTQNMNRVRAIVYRAKEGLSPTETIPNKEDDPKAHDEYMKEYSDAKLPGLMDELKSEIPSDTWERTQDYYAEAKSLKEKEDDCKRQMACLLYNEPVYKYYLQHIKGIGPVMAGGLICHLGYCERASNPSQLWAYVYDKFWKSEIYKYNVANKRTKGQQMSSNVRARTLMWKLAGGLIRCQGGSPYFYDLMTEYRKKEQARTYTKEELMDLYGYKPDSKKHPLKDGEVNHLNYGHIKNRTRRYGGKRFLAFYWAFCHEMMQFPMEVPYVQAKLGHKHMDTWRDMMEKQLAAKK